MADLRDTRIALGMSQAHVADSIGVSRSLVGRLERNDLQTPDPVHLAGFAAVLGLALRINA